MDEAELQSELKGLRSDINTLVTEVRDLRTSVHGNAPLNISGIHERLEKLEKDEERLSKDLDRLRAERDSVKSWFRGATWAFGALITLLTVGGGLSIRALLEVLNDLYSYMRASPL